MFRSWGKLGTTIGSQKVDQFTSKDKAVKAFTTTFQDKTGNVWSNSRQSFKKHPNKFYPMDIDFGAKVSAS